MDAFKKGTQVIIVFDDGGTITRKEGDYQKQDELFLYLKIKSETHLIPLTRIIRIQTTDIGGEV